MEDPGFAKKTVLQSIFNFPDLKYSFSGFYK